MKNLMLFCVLLCGLSAMAIAQTVPKSEIFGGYSYKRCENEGHGDADCNLHGWNASVSVNPNKHVGIVGDFGGHYGKVADAVDLKVNSIMIGPKITIRTPRVTPFVQALFGYAHVTAKLGPVVAGKGNFFAMAFGGGVDVNVSEYFAVRPVQADYFTIKTGNNFTKDFRYSGGVVFKLGQ